MNNKITLSFHENVIFRSKKYAEKINVAAANKSTLLQSLSNPAVNDFDDGWNIIIQLLKTGVIT
jgi:hypothetical protein